MLNNMGQSNIILFINHLYIINITIQFILIVSIHQNAPISYFLQPLNFMNHFHLAYTTPRNEHNHHNL